MNIQKKFVNIYLANQYILLKAHFTWEFNNTKILLVLIPGISWNSTHSK